MHKTRIRVIVIILIPLFFFAFSAILPTSSPQAKKKKGIKRIKHVVFIVKENRTFDNYFGTFPGADGATSGTISTGEVIPLGHTPDRTPNDIDHSFNGAVRAIDGGAMDKFNTLTGCGSYSGGNFL